MRKAPWTLWAYVGFSTAVFVVAAVINDPPSLHWLLPTLLAFEAVFAFFLLRGSRVMWWVLIVSGFGALPFYFTGDYLWQAPFTVIELGLLLAPSSRRYVFRPKQRPQKFTATSSPTKLGPQTSWDPDDHEDSTRPPGWYFEPDDADRMRYWRPSLGGWQPKTTRAPRKMRRARDAAAD